MYSVYVLKAVNRNLRYVGFTSKDVRSRLYEHNIGKNKYTKRYKWKLIYYEKGYCRKCARQREKFLKSGQGRKIIDFVEINKKKDKTTS